MRSHVLTVITDVDTIVMHFCGHLQGRFHAEEAALCLHVSATQLKAVSVHEPKFTALYKRLMWSLAFINEKSFNLQFVSYLRRNETVGMMISKLLYKYCM